MTRSVLGMMDTNTCLAEVLQCAISHNCDLYKDIVALRADIKRLSRANSVLMTENTMLRNEHEEWKREACKQQDHKKQGVASDNGIDAEITVDSCNHCPFVNKKLKVCLFRKIDPADIVSACAVRSTPEKCILKERKVLASVEAV